MHLMLNDDWLNRRNVRDLPALRLGIRTVQDGTTVAAALRFVVVNLADLIRWQELARVSSVTGLPTASLATRQLAFFLALVVGLVAGGRLRGIFRVELKLFFEFG
jgi:hypothetical protein